jgi:hypothetical protein
VILTELPREQNVILDGIRRFRRAEAARTGLHVSAIINDMLDFMDSSRERSHAAIDEETSLAFQEIGNVLEDVVAVGLVGRIPGWRKPRPRSYMGITGSPDGYSPRAACIDEIKVCWKSEKDFVETENGLTLDGRIAKGRVTAESLKFTGYVMQILFYMKLWEAVRGRLHVLFVAGSYRPPFPKPRTFLLKPTQREIDGNFDRIYQHARDVRKFRRLLEAA